MFQFLFEGKLGEILAPVTGASNKLFLAIQHFKNDEVVNLLATTPMDLRSNAECGYSAIHVASRYNNRYVIEVLISKGVPLDLPDASGNTPLHYAARYGHADLCRYLVDSGATSTTKRNSQSQTPYDTAESHIVRQYLLPLQLQSERQAAQEMFGGAPSSQSYQPQPAYGLQPPAQTPASGSQTFTAPAALPPSPHSAPSSSFRVASPPEGTSNTTSNTTSSTTSTSTLAPVGPPSFSMPVPLNLGRSVSAPSSIPEDRSSPLLAASSASAGPILSSSGESTPVTPKPSPMLRAASTTTSARMIQPDGFHSSASDPNLQLKYGHIKETINIAPPPTAPLPVTSANGASTSTGPPPTPQYSMFGASGANPTTYNRYVPYELHPTPVGVGVGAGAGTGVSPSASYGLPTYAKQHTLPTNFAPPPLLPPPPSHTIGSAPLPGSTAQTMVPPPPPSPLIHTTTPPLHPSTSRPPPAVPSAPVNIFNPSTDCDVISADANSRSVL